MPKEIERSGPKNDVKDNSLQGRWKRSTQLIKKKISAQGFNTWISPILPVSYIDGKLILRVPSQFFFEWLDSNFQDSIYEAVKKVYGLHTKIEYLVASTPDKQPEQLNLDSVQEEDQQAQEEHRESERYPTYYLDERFQFENFFVSNDNELALKAAQAVSSKPGKTDFNPMLIYGNAGCGKTHLLHAAGNYIQKNKKRKKVRLLNSETFLNEYIYALQNHKLELYNRKITELDVLLLDNIHFLSNKKKSQEGLLFLLSEMEFKRKQIIITSSHPPAQLIGFDKRLCSFFQKGLIVDLIPPSPDTRLHWIDEYCQKNQLSILPEVRNFLAQNFNEGLHQLRALMIRISAQSSLVGKPVSLARAKLISSQIDADWAQRNGDSRFLKPIKIEQIIKTVSEVMSVPYDLLVGYSRQREINIARQVAIYLSKKLSREPLKVIGYHFGDRHYTGILHNYKKIEEQLPDNPVLNKIVNDIQSKLQSL